MGRTEELDPPITDQYRSILREQIDDLGRDYVAGLAKVNASTIHRNVNEERLTYTTAMKIRSAIAKAYLEKTGKQMNFIPPPFAPVISQSHYDLCEMGAKLHELDGDKFGTLMEHAVRLLDDANRDHVLEVAKYEIAHPIRKRPRKKDRGD